MVRAAMMLTMAIGLAACLPKAAVGEAETAVMRQPTSAQAWVDLGDVYKRAGETEQAMTAYQRALALDPDNPELHARLQSLGARELTELERQALDNPADDEIWGDLADQYALQGRTDLALEHYLYALELDPTDSEWQRRIVELGGVEQVESIYGDVAQGTDDEAIGDFADMLWGAGETERSCDLYARANDLDPGDAEWIEKLGRCPGHAPVAGSAPPEHGGIIGGVVGGGGSASLVDDSLSARARDALDNGDAEQALRLFQTAALQNPTDREALAGVILLTGKGMVEVLEALTERVTDDDELWGDLGDARLAVGDVQGAVAAYAQAASLDPSDSEWADKLALLDREAPHLDERSDLFSAPHDEAHE